MYNAALAAGDDRRSGGNRSCHFTLSKLLHSMTAPRRRWFRFSLRTLFVVVTVLACWLSWNRSLVQRRRPFLEMAQSSGGIILLTFDEFRTGEWGRGASDAELRQSWKSKFLSLGLRLFGEKTYALVLVVDNQDTLADLQPVIDAFPEASVGAGSAAAITIVSGPLKTGKSSDESP
jgi:hypothetical protein